MKRLLILGALFIVAVSYGVTQVWSQQIEDKATTYQYCGNMSPSIYMSYAVSLRNGGANYSTGFRFINDTDKVVIQQELLDKLANKQEGDVYLVTYTPAPHTVHYMYLIRILGMDSRWQSYIWSVNIAGEVQDDLTGIH